VAKPFETENLYFFAKTKQKIGFVLRSLQTGESSSERDPAPESQEEPPEKWGGPIHSSPPHGDAPALKPGPSLLPAHVDVLMSCKAILSWFFTLLLELSNLFFFWGGG